MSRDATLTTDWADDTYTFRLGYRQLMELQEKTDAGPDWVLRRLMVPSAENRGWRVEDVSNVIRLGLIGGGMAPVDALKLVRRHVEDRPVMESMMLAQSILSVALYGAPEDEKKSLDPATENVSTASPEANGASQLSSDPEPPSASRRKKSKTAQSGN